MSAKVFLDTNIIVYSYSATELEKQQKARDLIASYNSVISTQVLTELCNVITKRFGRSYAEVSGVIAECVTNNELYVNDDQTVLKACDIAERYKYSFYDSLIIAAALKSGCVTLYSEDMHHGHLIDEKLTITNPFK